MIIIKNFILWKNNNYSYERLPDRERSCISLCNVKSLLCFCMQSFVFHLSKNIEVFCWHFKHLQDVTKFSITISRWVYIFELDGNLIKEITIKFKVFLLLKRSFNFAKETTSRKRLVLSIDNIEIRWWNHYF